MTFRLIGPFSSTAMSPEEKADRITGCNLQTTQIVLLLDFVHQHMSTIER